MVDPVARWAADLPCGTDRMLDAVALFPFSPVEDGRNFA